MFVINWQFSAVFYLQLSFANIFFLLEIEFFIVFQTFQFRTWPHARWDKSLQDLEFYITRLAFWAASTFFKSSSFCRGKKSLYQWNNKVFKFQIKTSSKQNISIVNIFLHCSLNAIPFFLSLHTTFSYFLISKQDKIY